MLTFLLACIPHHWCNSKNYLKYLLKMRRPFFRSPNSLLLLNFPLKCLSAATLGTSKSLDGQNTLPAALGRRQYSDSSSDGLVPILKGLPLVIPVGSSTYTIQQSGASPTPNTYSVPNLSSNQEPTASVSPPESSAVNPSQSINVYSILSSASTSICSTEVATVTLSTQSQTSTSLQHSASVTSVGSLNAISVLNGTPTGSISSKTSNPSSVSISQSVVAKSGSTNGVSSSVSPSSPTSSGAETIGTEASVSSALEIPNAYTILNSAILTQSSANTVMTFPILPTPLASEQASASYTLQAGTTTSSLSPSGEGSSMISSGTSITTRLTFMPPSSIGTEITQASTSSPVTFPPGIASMTSNPIGSSVQPTATPGQTTSAAASEGSTQSAPTNASSQSLQTGSGQSTVTTTSTLSMSSTNTVTTGGASTTEGTSQATESQQSSPSSGSIPSTMPSVSPRLTTTESSSNRPASATAAPPANGGHSHKDIAVLATNAFLAWSAACIIL